MEKKIKILLVLLLVTLLAGACSQKKSDNSGILALLLLNKSDDDDDDDDVVNPTIDLTKAFKGLSDVIAVKSSTKLEASISFALEPDKWTRLKNAKTVKVPKGTKLDFAIVPKTGDINATLTIEIGTYTGTGKTDTIGFGDADKGGISLKSGYDSYGVTAVALIAKDVAAATSKFTVLKTAAEGDSGILKADTSAKVTTALDTITGEDAFKTSAKTAAEDSKVKTAQTDAGGKEGTTPDPPKPDDAPPITFTIDQDGADAVNLTASAAFVTANSNQNVTLTISSTTNDAVFFMYWQTVAANGDLSGVTPTTNIHAVTPTASNKHTMPMNFTSSYVYRVGACKAGTTKADLGKDKQCSWQTRSLVWAPTIAVTAQTDNDGSFNSGVLKLKLASLDDAEYDNGKGFYKKANIKVIQMKDDRSAEFGADDPGTLSITTAAAGAGGETGVLTTARVIGSGELSIKYFATGAGSDEGTSSIHYSNVSGTIKIIATDPSNAANKKESIITIGANYFTNNP